MAPSIYHLEIQPMKFHVAFVLHHENGKATGEYARRPNKAGPLGHEYSCPVIMLYKGTISSSQLNSTRLDSTQLNIDTIK